MRGEQHTAVNLAALLLSAGLAAWAAPPALHLPLCGAGAGFLLGTLWITPDLDLPRNDARRRWGRLGLIWTPYASLHRHRGLSHSYLLGPLGRLLYLTVLLGLLGALIWALLWPQINRVWPANWHAPPLLLGALGGYLASQWLHLLCDRIVPFSRRHRA